MPLGPIEVVVVAFPENRFTGEIVPEIRRLIENEVISVIDGVFVRRNDDGSSEFIEFEQLDANDDAAPLAALVSDAQGLVSDDDVEQLTSNLQPNSSAAILVFEHTWAKALRDAIVRAGGVLASDVRIPGAVVEEVLASVATEGTQATVDAT